MKIFLISVGFLFLQIASLPVAAQSAADEKAKAYYFAAEEAFSKGAFSDALAQLVEAEKALGKSMALTSALRVKILVAAEQFQTAKAELENFYTLSPSVELSREMSGYLATIDENLKQAELEHEKRVVHFGKHSKGRRFAPYQNPSDSLWGYIDSQGKTAVPFRYVKVARMYNRLFGNFSKQYSPPRVDIYDAETLEKVSAENQMALFEVEDIRESGMLKVVHFQSINYNKHGWVDFSNTTVTTGLFDAKTLKEVVPFGKFRHIGDLKYGFRVVELKGSDSFMFRYGVIDQYGNVVIDPMDEDEKICDGLIEYKENQVVFFYECGGPVRVLK